MATSKTTIIDTVYFGTAFGIEDRSNAIIEQNFIEEFKKKFPDAAIDDAQDRTMGYSQSIRIENIYRNDYYAWMVARGWGGTSTIMKTESLSKKKFKQRVTKLAKAKYPHTFE
jgi:hypothetical protein